ncbi:MAG: putative membrane protein YedE/YeeE [Reinekea sp.]
MTGNLLVVAIAGIFVGVGTRIANGCTSGHGVCGISRLSLRGIVATVFYIGAGGLTVLLFKHILGVI